MFVCLLFGKRVWCLLFTIMCLRRVLLFVVWRMLVVVELFHIDVFCVFCVVYYVLCVVCCAVNTCCVSFFCLVCGSCV